MINKCCGLYISGWLHLRNASLLSVALTVMHRSCLSCHPIFSQTCTRQPFLLLVTPAAYVQVTAWHRFVRKLAGKISGCSLGKMFLRCQIWSMGQDLVPVGLVDCKLDRPCTKAFLPAMLPFHWPLPTTQGF